MNGIPTKKWPKTAIRVSVAYSNNIYFFIYTGDNGSNVPNVFV